MRHRHPTGPTSRVASLVEADVCIIGAGPAGIALGLGLLDHGLHVVILESGTLEPTTASQSLNEGEVVGDPYAGLVGTRHRAWGGTVRIWNTPVDGEPGAKYVPLDPVDLSGASSSGLGAWPIEWKALVPWFERAQSVCGLGPFDYDGDTWSSSERPCLPQETAPFVSRIYQFGPGGVFTDEHRVRLLRGANMRIFDRATVCGLPGRDTSGRTHRAEVAGVDGVRRAVEARAFVLCCGAVENARLLLASARAHGSPRANRWLGRGFMEHPRDRSLVWVPETPELFGAIRFFDRHRAPDGTIVGGRLAVADEVVADVGNASISLLPRPTDPGRWRRSWESLRRLRLPIPRGARAGYGWSDRSRPERRYKDVQVLVNLEQIPHPQNRIELSGSTDRLGVPRPRLHWRWFGEDQARLERLRPLIRESLQATGLGPVVQVHSDPPDPNAHHHAGTTRMHEDPDAGVVDGFGRVHGTDDLFVAGASVFPSAGFANPTLTIVALSLRLAETLRSRLG